MVSPYFGPFSVHNSYTYLLLTRISSSLSRPFFFSIFPLFQDNNSSRLALVTDVDCSIDNVAVIVFISHCFDACST